MENYVENYPRPQFIRDRWRSLDGEWQFAMDDRRIGQKERWFEEFPQARKIVVPFTYETRLSGIGDQQPHPQVWYQRTFVVDGLELADKLLLHFEGSDYQTKVWLNGAYIGEHQGAYDRFSFELTEAVKLGENVITVQVIDEQREEQPRGKQRWTGENYACWYVQTTGIWKSVWLEWTPQNYLTSVKMTPSVTTESLDVELTAELGAADGAVQVLMIVSFEGQEVTRALVPLREGYARTRLDLYNKQIFEWGIRTWSVEHPDLYDIIFILENGGKETDRVRSYFGMREIAVNQGNILLNGKPVYQRLILDQGYWEDSHLTPPGEQALKEDVEKIKAMGYNGVRKHQKVEDERFLYWCDTLGLLVWSEMGSNYIIRDEGTEAFTRQWLRVVRQNYNHPSIITWVPFNESWGITRVMTEKGQQALVQGIYYLTKAIDPMRLVVGNDGWEHTVTDIVTLHDYEQYAHLLERRYREQLGEILDNRVYHNGFKCAFAEGFRYQGQPVIISEFGGIAFDGENEGWGYGNKVNSEAEFMKRFDEIVTAVKQAPGVCGYCYTQVSDVQQEINGLLDKDHQFKVDSSQIKEVNERYTGCYQKIYN